MERAIQEGGKGGRKRGKGGVRERRSDRNTVSHKMITFLCRFVMV